MLPIIFSKATETPYVGVPDFATKKKLYIFKPSNAPSCVLLSLIHPAFPTCSLVSCIGL